MVCSSAYVEEKLDDRSMAVAGGQMERRVLGHHAVDVGLDEKVQPHEILQLEKLLEHIHPPVLGGQIQRAQPRLVALCRIAAIFKQYSCLGRGVVVVCVCVWGMCE